jgi:hypothetical protein
MKHLACMIALTLSLAVTAADERHPLTAAIDANTNLRVVARLNPTNRQLLEILAAARAARQVVTTYEQSTQQALQARAGLFEQQARALAQGTPVAAQVTDGIAAHYAAQDENRLTMMRGVDVQVRQVRRALAPDQAGLVSWARPDEISTETDDQVVLAEMRQVLADVNETARLLERIRYLIVSDYSITRIGRLTEFLRQYYRPNTREFDDAMEWMLRLTDEVRLVSENDWPGQAALFAGRVLLRVGALETQDQPRAQAPYNWWDVYYLLTDVHTPELLLALLAARGNPAGEQ